MQIKRIVVLTVIIVTGTLWAHTQVPSDPLAQLVEQITVNCPTDTDKSRAIYKWIVSNMRYDWEKYKRWQTGERVEVKSMEELIERKTGICSDFTWLTSKMFEKAKIQCVIIDGYAKFELEDFQKSSRQLRHSWNAIFLNGKWQLMDPTWATLSYQYGDSADLFYLTAPELFIYTHFPDNYAYAFLRKNITLEDFLAYPILKSNFSGDEIREMPQTAFLKPSDGVVCLKLPRLESIEFELKDQGLNSSYPDYEKVNSSDRYDLYKISLPEKRKYFLSVNKLVKVDDRSEDIKPLLLFIINN